MTLIDSTNWDLWLLGLSLLWVGVEVLVWTTPTRTEEDRDD